MSQKYTIALAIAVIISIAIFSSVTLPDKDESLRTKFNEWKNEYSMSFDPTEEVYRFNIFVKNLNQIESHNSKLERTYELGLNMFSHLTNDEFAAKYLTTAVKQR